MIVCRRKNLHFRRGGVGDQRGCTSRRMSPYCARHLIIDLDRLARSLTRSGPNRTNRNCRRPEGEKPVTIP